MQTNQVLLLLKATPEEYESIVLQFYFNWCTQKAINKKSLQKVLTCPPLFNWWKKELAKLEQVFIDDAKVYNNSITKIDAHKLYHITTAKLYNRFSKPLIKYANES